MRLTEKADGPIQSNSSVPNFRDLAALARTGFGQEDNERALAWMLDTPCSGIHLKGRVFSYGFDWHNKEEGFCAATPYENRILSKLKAITLTEFPESSETPFPAAKVPDVCAEARLAAKILLGSTGNALVLVPDQTTAQRLSAAARRNGIACSGTDKKGYGAHALAPILKTMLPWFDLRNGDDPLIRASHLEKVLCDPFVGNAFPVDVKNQLISEISTADASGYVEEETILRLGAREVNDALRQCRIMEAPLSKFQKRTRELSNHIPDGRQKDNRRTMMILHQRLSRLSDCIKGRQFEFEDVPDDANRNASVPEDRKLVRSANTHELERPVSKSGTFGAMLRFLMDCGVRMLNDRCARALMGELNSERNQRATERELMRILGGSASQGIINDGTTILNYEDYDGRKTDTLIMLGVHNKGLALAPAPDPILNDAGLTALGLPTPAGIIRYRIAQARRASRNARQFIAIVTERDSTGRRVVAPVQLVLDYHSSAVSSLVGTDVFTSETEKDSFGRRTGLPEAIGSLHKHIERIETRARIEAMNNPPLEPASPDDAIGRLAVQSSAEWYRRGAGIANYPARLKKAMKDGTMTRDLLELTLGEQKELIGQPGPDAVMPYLGNTGPLPTQWDKDKEGNQREWSSSSRFTPLTNCLYRFLAECVLNIKELEPITDELDARETGTAIHNVFEEAAKLDNGIEWRVTPDKEINKTEALELARRTAMQTLHRILDAEFNKVEKIIEQPVIEEATKALRTRWKNRIGIENSDGITGYVSERIHAASDLKEKARKQALIDFRTESEIYAELLDELEESLSAWTAKANTNDLRTTWLTAFLRRLADGKTVPEGEELALGVAFPKKALPILENFVRNETCKTQMNKAIKELNNALDKAFVLHGPIIARYAEFGFGRESGNPVSLNIRTGGLPVQGRVDLLSVVESKQGEHAISLLDYKTGQLDKAVRDGMVRLYRPQLPLYALAVETLIKTGTMGAMSLPPDSSVAQLAYDFVQDASGLIDDHLLSPEMKNSILENLARLVNCVEKGEFWPMPIAKDSWGYPKGRISLEEAARPITLPEPPSLKGDESDFDKEVRS